MPESTTNNSLELPTKISPPSNPFAACNLDPKRIPWLAVDHIDIESLTERAVNGPALQLIVGPHGTGKSALLSDLFKRISALRPDWQLTWISADSRERSEPIAKTTRDSSQPRLLGIDGLDSWPLQRIAAYYWSTRWRKVKMIGTTHRARWLPVLAELHPTLTQLERVVDHLLRRQATGSFPDPELLRHLFQFHAGNLRNALFDLYDWWEAEQGKHVSSHTLPESIRAWESEQSVR